jgi:hypothetical protein
LSPARLPISPLRQSLFYDIVRAVKSQEKSANFFAFVGKVFFLEQIFLFKFQESFGKPERLLFLAPYGERNFSKD